jgi:hypothetical protein
MTKKEMKKNLKELIAIKNANESMEYKWGMSFVLGWIAEAEFGDDAAKVIEEIMKELKKEGK